AYRPARTALPAVGPDMPPHRRFPAARDWSPAPAGPAPHAAAPQPAARRRLAGARSYPRSATDARTATGRLVPPAPELHPPAAPPAHPLPARPPVLDRRHRPARLATPHPGTGPP